MASPIEESEHRWWVMSTDGVALELEQHGGQWVFVPNNPVGIKDILPKEIEIIRLRIEHNEKGMVEIKI